MRDAIDLLLPKLAKVISNVAKFAVQWKGVPTLAYTHLQPGLYFENTICHCQMTCLLTLTFPIAQLITVGKRAAQWAQDLMFDLEIIEHVRNGIKFRGAFLVYLPLSRLSPGPKSPLFIGLNNICAKDTNDFTYYHHY